MVVAIIQARMNSSRLPGKMLKQVGGKPLIDFVLDAVEAIPVIDHIVVATSNTKTDDPLANHVSERKIAVFRGNEDDVLSRYYLAAKKYKSEHVVRITGDCPLFDPKITTEFINWYLKKGYDYARLAPEFAEGLDSEIFSFKILQQAHQKASKKSEREHVTLYFHNNSAQFKMGVYPNKTDDSRYRFTVDEPEDFKVISRIIAALYDNTPIDSKKIIDFLDANPKILQANSHIIRNEGVIKSLRAEKKIIIRADGSPTLGMGHIMRCIGLAQALRNKKIDPLFVTRNQEAKQRIEDFGFQVKTIPTTLKLKDEASFLLSLKPNLTIFDLNNGNVLKQKFHFEELLKNLQSKTKICLIDGLGDEQVSAHFSAPIDCLVIPYYVGSTSFKFTMPSNVCLIGPKYFIFRDDFVSGDTKNKHQGTNLLISLGGGDTLPITEKVISLLPKGKHKIRLTLGVDAQPKNKTRLTKRLKSKGYSADVMLNEINMSHHMTWADIAILTSGLTRYEAAAMGLPSISLSYDPSHIELMDDFAKSGTTIHLGHWQHINPNTFVKTYTDLLSNHMLRKQMSTAGKQLVNIHGRDRIVESLLSHL